MSTRIGRDGLTPRQREVLELRFEGLSCDEVGARLGITEITVRNHIREAYVRLDVSRQMDAFRAAGLIPAMTREAAR